MMVKYFKLLLYTLVVLTSCSVSTLSAGELTVDMEVLPIKPLTTCALEEDYDLGGKCYLLPPGITIIASHGVFKNGTLVGQNTRIKGNGPVFNNVTIKGEWNVPLIYSSFFLDLSYNNSLRDVFALASPNVHNTIYIAIGDYYVSAGLFEASLLVPSNTELIIDGHIKLRPNSHKGCYIIGVHNARNVIIKGNGIIEGDKYDHKGEIGEWGHGIDVHSGNNVCIKDLTIQNCWGDCIYVGHNSKDIKIKNCKLLGSRRQGVSITSGTNVKILNCYIKGIYGTFPQYAVDVEPNANESVGTVVIKGVIVEDCYGGFASWGGEKDASVNRITLKNCSVKNVKAPRPVRFSVSKKVHIKNCFFDTGERVGIFMEVIDDIKINNNIILTSYSPEIEVRNSLKRRIENNKFLK